MKIRISRDVYNISNRVKRIDRDYYIVYDTISRNYEVHNSSQLGSSYCLTLPNRELDARALEHVHCTKVSNIDEILASIDRENDSLDRDNRRNAVNAIGEIIEKGDNE